MFRTDIGSKVNAENCTTRFGEYLCNECENRFNHIDAHAQYVWKYICTGEIETKKKPPAVNMKVVLFSIMARAMHISLECAPPNFMNAFCEMLKDKNIHTYEHTVSVLDKAGFIYYNFDLDHRRYRVEFPFPCDLKLGEQVIKTICAQVPPYFCLMPWEPKHADILGSHIKDIMTAVHDELNKALERFHKETETKRTTDNTQCKRKTLKEKRFLMWYRQFLPRKKFHATGPLLIFNYVEEVLHVVVYK